MRLASILALCLGLAPWAGASAQTAGERCPRTPLAPMGEAAGGARVDRSIAPTKQGQMAQAFENVKIALEAAHAHTDQVVAMNVYIVGYTEADLEELAHCTAAYFPPDHLPTSTLVPVPRLARTELLFEIDVTAVIPSP